MYPQVFLELWPQKYDAVIEQLITTNIILFGDGDIGFLLSPVRLKMFWQGSIRGIFNSVSSGNEQQQKHSSGILRERKLKYTQDPKNVGTLWKI